MSVKSANDLLRKAGIVAVADCSKCEHSKPHPQYFANWGRRMCMAYGGQDCIIINQNGTCQKFEARRDDDPEEVPAEADRLPPGVIANCSECRHSEPHLQFFSLNGVRLCGARGGEECKYVNRDGRCKDFDPNGEVSPKAKKGFWARIFRR